MTKATPATPTVSIASIKKTKKIDAHVPEADDLVSRAKKLGLGLCRGLSPKHKHKRARELFNAVDKYAQARDRDRALPNFTETIKEFKRVERVLSKAAAVLGDMDLLAIQRLEQDLHFPARGPVIEKLDQMSDAAAAHRRRLLAERDRARKPVPHDPHILKLVRVANGIYRASGGTKKGAWRDTYGDRGHAGRLIDLIKLAFELGPDCHRKPDEEIFPGNTAIANALAKIK